MTFQFYNSSNQVITPQQANGFYFKHYFNNGEIKRIEQYSDLEIEYIVYFKEVSEDDNQILAVFNTILSLKEVDINRSETYYTYRIEFSSSYVKDSVGNFQLNEYETKSLFNSMNDSICTESLNRLLPSNHPEYRTISKAHTFRHDLAVEFFYCFFNNDGSFNYLEYNPAPQDQDTQDILTYNFQEALDFMSALGFSDNMKAWYVSDVFLPPI